MNRRGFLAGGGAGAAGWAGGLWRAAAASPPATTPRLSMGEYWPYVREPAEKIQKRFDLYKQIGFGTLRVGGFDWRVLETSEGNWRIPPFLSDYLKQAIDNKFRLKLTVGTLGAPAPWYLKAHPDARISNAAGEYSKNDLSLWYPGLHALLAEKTDKLFGHLAQLGLFPAIDFIFVDLGPASEPIYPAPWTMGKARTHGPWFYDEHARAAFAHAMRRKHSRLERANRLWGTTFASWRDIELPRPGEHSGILWQDALLWYRDSKRDFIRRQVANYRRALGRQAAADGVKLIIMVPGTHIRPEEWSEAARSGAPDDSLTIMSDSQFLLDLAKETGCWLQYTGLENENEVAYLLGYMRAHRIEEPMWGENAGLDSVARDPAHLTDVVLTNHLYGLEYVRSSYLFSSDGTTPNGTFRALGKACSRLRRHF